MRPRLVRNRDKTNDGEKCYDFKKEFDLLVARTYNTVSAEDRRLLWKLTGSILLHINDSRNPQDRLIKALKQAHEQLS